MPVPRRREGIGPVKPLVCGGRIGSAGSSEIRGYINRSDRAATTPCCANNPKGSSPSGCQAFEAVAPASALQAISPAERLAGFEARQTRGSGLDDFGRGRRRDRGETVLRWCPRRCAPRRSPKSACLR